MDAAFDLEQPARILNDLSVEGLVAGLQDHDLREIFHVGVARLTSEVEHQPNDWRRWYRLARAYDYAGDRARARETMTKAVDMQAKESQK